MNITSEALFGRAVLAPTSPENRFAWAVPNLNTNIRLSDGVSKIKCCAPLPLGLRRTGAT